MTQHEKSLQARIAAIKGEIAALGEMRPGALTEQYNVCGQENCRCKDKKNPQRHGPYHQLSYTRKGRSTSEFVKADDVAGVQSQLADYKRFMALKDEWVGISIALAKLRRAAKRKA
jgi:hypothetical protein